MDEHDRHGVHRIPGGNATVDQLQLLGTRPEVGCERSALQHSHRGVLVERAKALLELRFGERSAGSGEHNGSAAPHQSQQGVLDPY